MVDYCRRTRAIKTHGSTAKSPTSQWVFNGWSIPSRSVRHRTHDGLRVDLERNNHLSGQRYASMISHPAARDIPVNVDGTLVLHNTGFDEGWISTGSVAAGPSSLRARKTLDRPERP
jgi:hypothetical protein